MTAKPADLVNQAIRTQETYAEVLPHIKSLIRTAEANPCKAVISQIKKLIKDKKIASTQKVLALELFQECMMLRNPHYLTYAQSKILSRLSILAAKKSTDLFPDSKKTPDLTQASERFIHNLLVYIQIWAHNFGISQTGEVTLYTVYYSRLREKVVFPVIKAPVAAAKPQPSAQPIRKDIYQPIINKSITNKPIAKKTRNDKDTIEYFENLLTIIEEIEDPYNDETGKEFIDNLMQLKGDVERLINEALGDDNGEEIEKLFQLNERTEAIMKKKPAGIAKEKSLRNSISTTVNPPSKTEEVKYSTVQAKEKASNRISTPPRQRNYDNILDLDFSPTIDTKAQFNTYHVSNPIIFPSPVLEKPEIITKLPPEPDKQEETIKEQELLQLKQSLKEKDDIIARLNQHISASNSKDEEFLQLKISLKEKDDLLAGLNQNMLGSNLKNEENLQLTIALKEKDEIISGLNQNMLMLKLRNDELEASLKQTILILRSKEKECEEYHCLKEENKEHDLLDELFLSPTHAKQEKIEINEPKADNDNIFRLSCIENTAVLFDNDILQLGFQILHDISILKMNVYIGNKSQDPLINIETNIQKST